MRKNSLEELKKNSRLVFYEDISEEEINILKQNRNLNKIDFYYNNFLNINKVINSLDINQIDYVISINSLDNIDVKSLSVIENKNNVKVWLQEFNPNVVDLDKLLVVESLLDLFVKDIKASNLSVLEKYLCVYNIVKKFKAYNEELIEDDSKVSRDIYNILFNEYIVCVGFTNLCINLLNRIGISSVSANFYIDKDAIVEGHQRNLVSIIDDKYNINGIYFADACWDNSYDKDYYLHVLITEEELEQEDCEYIKNKFKILNCDTIEKFTSLLKFYNNISEVLYIIRMLRYEEYIYLEKKYFINLKEDKYNEVLLINAEFLEEFYDLINKLFKNKVDINIIFEALRNVDKFVFNDISKKEIENLYNQRKIDYKEQKNEYYKKC